MLDAPVLPTLTSRQVLEQAFTEDLAAAMQAMLANQRDPDQPLTIETTVRVTVPAWAAAEVAELSLARAFLANAATPA